MPELRGNYPLIVAICGVITLWGLSIPQILQAQEIEIVIMKVMLNTEDKGEYFFSQTSDGDVVFKPEDLKEIGIIKIPKTKEIIIEGHKYIPLSDLSPDVTFELNDKEATIFITAKPELLEKQFFDLSYQDPHEVSLTKDNTAFANYNVRYSVDDDFDFTSLSIPWEVGTNIKGVLGFSNFSYTQNNTDDKFVRLNTNVTKDYPQSLNRLIIGDFAAFSGKLGSGGSFGGISFSKDFSTEPFFIKFPGLDFLGYVETPSDLEIYVNGLLAKSIHLSPGEFKFSNLPLATGSGEISAIIKDAFGRERRIEELFYVSTSLLKPGLHEYSYNVGFTREKLGQESFEYGGPAFVGFHRLGITKSFTGGLRAEADEDVVNIGTNLIFLLWKAGEIDTSIAVSQEDERYGYGGFIDYIYSGRGFNVRLSGESLSREYANLTMGKSQDKARFNGAVGMGFSNKFLGSISANYSITDNYVGTDTKRYSLFYNRNLIRNISLNMAARRTETDSVEDEISVGLNFFFAKGISGRFGIRSQENRVTESVSIQKNPPLGKGFGFRALADRQETEREEKEVGGSTSIQYRGNIGIYSADYRRSAGKNSYDLNVSGGVGFIDKSIHLSRPINDSFALVKVGTLKGVKVYYSNQLVGKTNKRGEAFVPNLISYNDNKLSIDDKDIPVNYEIREIDRHISTPLRGGGLVNFDVSSLQGFVGYLFFSQQGVKTPAEYAGLEMQLEDRLVEFIVGKEGEFYMENVPPGNWPARLFFKDKDCSFIMSIPSSDDIFVDMGDIVCEMD